MFQSVLLLLSFQILCNIFLYLFIEIHIIRKTDARWEFIYSLDEGHFLSGFVAAPQDILRFSEAPEQNQEMDL